MEKIKEFYKKYKKQILSTAILIFWIVLTGLEGVQMTEKISYNDFLKKVDNGEIETISLNSSKQYIELVDKEGNIMLTAHPRTDDFKEQMLKKDIEVVELNNETLKNVFSLISYILPIAILLSIVKSSKSITNVTFEPQEIPNISFKNIAGHKEAMEDIKLLIEFLKNPSKYTEIDAKLPKGALLYGPPGTGKTLTAKAIAGEAGVPFFTASGSDFVELYVGMGSRKIRNLFQTAKQNAPCIIFIDEIDSLAQKRGMHSNNTEAEQTLNALLAEMDGFSGSDGIIVIGATNRLEVLDPAVLRPGRFDRHIAINLPDKKERKSILELHLEKKKIDKSVNIDELSKITIGFSGAALAGLVNEAAIEAVNKDREYITSVDFDNAYLKLITKGHIKKDSIRSEEENTIVAYHEAGHALAAKLLTDHEVPKVSIAATTSGAGGFTISIPKSLSLLSKNDIENEIKILYAGRAAEEILLGSSQEVTTGASNDIQKATQYIKQYFSNYGMSKEFGLIDVTQYENADTLEHSIKLSNQLYEDVLNLLRENIVVLDNIASNLLKHETIEEDKLDFIIEDSIIKQKAKES